MVGHLGFESVTFQGKPIASDYFHYLHHKYVTCNFGMDMMPWDKWLGVGLPTGSGIISRKDGRWSRNLTHKLTP